MAQELELITGPVEVYWGPVGETFTAIGSAVAGNWVLLGTSGSKNYTEDGVTIRSEKATEVFRSLGSPYPRASYITEADVFVDVDLKDYTLTQLRTALNQNTVTSDGGGFDWISLETEGDVSEIAIQIRGVGKSPLLAGGHIQWNLPRMFEEGSREWGMVKGVPAGSTLSFRAIYDEGATYPVGRIVADDT
jgi:hypothetical protein